MKWRGRALSFVALGLAFAVTGAPGAAQEAQAPRVELDGDTYFATIHIRSMVQWRDRDNPPMRTPIPLVDPTAWFDASSAVAQAHTSDPDQTKFLHLEMEIAPDGSVEDCKIEQAWEDWISQAAICSDVEGQKFRPALGNDGQPIGGRYHVSLSSGWIYPDPSGSPRPMFADAPAPSPPPMLNPSASRWKVFPPRNFESWWLLGEPEWKEAPYSGLRDQTLTGSETGVAVIKGGLSRGKSTKSDCRVIQSSGDRKQDRAACRYALRKLSPDWSDAGRYRERAVPIYLRPEGKGFFAIGPAAQRINRTKMEPASDIALVDALSEAGLLREGRSSSDLRLYLTAASDGEVTHCRIVRTTGTDEGDIAACHAAKSVVRLAVRENIFGTPDAKGGVFWDANPEAE